MEGWIVRKILREWHTRRQPNANAKQKKADGRTFKNDTMLNGYHC